MSDEREHFISDEDEELKRIRQKKLEKLAEKKEREQAMSVEPIHMTDSNFDEMIRKHPLALIDFWAGWCGPCQALAPTIKKLADEHAGKVFVGKLDVDENPKTAERFQVFSIPTLVVMKGGKEVERIVGLCPKSNIDVCLKKHFG